MKNKIVIIIGKQEIGKSQLALSLSKKYPNVSFITSNNLHLDMSSINFENYNK